jgi:DNA-binding PadR family transcriptional regulator
MTRRSGVLEFAVLGLLRESPMHGYELRKRLNTSLGVFRAFSYGSLYPCLKSLLQRGLLSEEPGSTPPHQDREGATPLTGRRAKIVYRLTAEGRAYFQELLAQPGPDAWDDEHFGVRFAFFGQTSHEVRMRVLEGRRSRLEERLARMRASLARTGQRLDAYTLELQRHGVESVEREVRWLGELIESERGGREREQGAKPPTPPSPPPPPSSPSSPPSQRPTDASGGPA